MIWNLTGRRSYVTDYTNASRIMLMDLKKHRWDRELLEFFKIPEGILPEIKTSLSSDGLGHLMEADLPAAQINADLGDQQAALFGERCFSEGNTKVTYGTGSFILQNTGKKVVKNGKGLISTCAYGEIDGSCKYALEGSTQVAGELFDWLTSKLQMFKSLKDIKRNFDKDYQSSVHIVPAFNGLFAPYWDDSARGLIIGLSGNSNKKDIVSAAYRAVCMQVDDIVSLLKPIRGDIKVDGGVSRDDDMMQLQADLLERKLLRSEMQEATVFGAALAAGLSSDTWSTEEIKSFYPGGRVFYPKMGDEKVDNIKRDWKKAVERSLHWIS